MKVGSGFAATVKWREWVLMRRNTAMKSLLNGLSLLRVQVPG